MATSFPSKKDTALIFKSCPMIHINAHCIKRTKWLGEKWKKKATDGENKGSSYFPPKSKKKIKFSKEFPLIFILKNFNWKL